MDTLIQKLTEIPAPPGYESRIREAVREEIAPLSDALRTDGLGNLIARKGMGGTKILLTAHLDEVGVMVSHVDEAGFVRFLPVGPVDPRTCPGGQVRFLNGATGVIGLERQEDAGRPAAFEGMFIDLGSAGRDVCPVQVGDVAVFERPWLDLGGRRVSKALDNRVGVAVLIEIMRRLSAADGGTPQEVYFVFSVQGQVGARGVGAAAYEIDPDLGLAVELTSSSDTPRGPRRGVRLGGGPAIKVRDGSMLADPRVVDWMAAAAAQAGLPYQMEVLETGSTAAGVLQLARAGVPSGCLSIPCRYVHSPEEMVDWADVRNAAALLAELLHSSIPFLGNRMQVGR